MDTYKRVIAAGALCLLATAGALPALVRVPSWLSYGIVGSLALMAAALLARVALEALSD